MTTIFKGFINRKYSILSLKCRLVFRTYHNLGKIKLDPQTEDLSASAKEKTGFKLFGLIDLVGIKCKISATINGIDNSLLSLTII